MEKVKLFVKWIVIAFGVGLSVIGVPLAINECYKCGGSYITQWEAEDVLSYYGTIIAAAGAMLGVFLTIRYSHKQYRENLRLSRCPLFTIDVLKQKVISPNNDLAEEKRIDNLHKNDSGYQEYRFDRVFFVIEDNTISLSQKLNEAQEEMRRNGGFEIEKKISGTIYKQCACYIPHDIKNVGAGCAINMVVALCKMQSDKNAICKPISVNVGEGLYVGILFEADESTVGEYDLKLSYYDVMGNRYVQDRFIKVKKGKRGFEVHEDSKTIQRSVNGEAVIIC